MNYNRKPIKPFQEADSYEEGHFSGSAARFGGVLWLCAGASPGRRGRWKHGHVCNYEQGNGQVPIEWIVLDRQEERALLLSKCALDAKPFHEVEDRTVTWAECTLRAWLNGDFYNSAFSDEERARIVQVTNTTAKARTRRTAFSC